ncbi:type II secretion system protein [Janthinobacterium sp. 17J80-10]|uniref:type II secretion system protein n=1 Tax=Janthinobacterium sp. 17J80-10 TaxID=2497863 RepID=UPI0010057C88|nr:type II secretion system protein [Janthinobacterium sp. 17J80-10]QAU34271.1 type II secretion system protein [Janthinobacterium sp. 17J80-10]
MMKVQQAGDQRGFSRLELMVVVLVFGILAAVLLERLRFYQEMAEKARMEYTVSRIKSGLRLRMAGLLVAGRAQEYSTLAKQNPIEWLDDKQENYAGEFASEKGQHALPGTWNFDRTDRMLVYSVQHGAHFQPDSTGRKQVRLKVITIRNTDGGVPNVVANEPSDSVAVEFVEAYRWFSQD